MVQAEIEARDGQSFTFVIVGGGTAGCVLASRLSADQRNTVLLLEAGGAAQPSSADAPARWMEATGSAFDWRFLTLPQTRASGLVMPAPRGKLLGGSSVINALAHHAGTADDFDRWVLQGAPGWGAAAMTPLFRRVESWRGPADPRRGADGPVVVMPVPSSSPAVARFIDGATRLGHALVDDLNADPGSGVSPNQLAFDGQHRMSAARAYLGPAQTSANLTVSTKSVVLGLDLVGGRCVGVRYQRDGRAYRAVVEREAIVSAGAFQSPQILMLSGIGPASAIRSLDLRAVLDVPDVGAGLQEHVLFAGHAIETRVEFPASRFMGTDVVLYARSRHAGPARDILLNFATGISSGGMPAGCRTSFSFLKPRSRGRVTLRSADPLSPPDIDPNVFHDPVDLDGATDALELSRSILNGPAFADLFVREIRPGADVATRGAVRDLLSQTALSFGHWGGTCRMGEDEDAVVDPSLRVRGVDNLRVADASVMPDLPAAPTNATVLAIAEHAADLIIADRP